MPLTRQISSNRLLFIIQVRLQHWQIPVLRGLNDFVELFII